MKNLSPKITFIIFALNIIVTGIVAVPPAAGNISLVADKKLLNLEKKTQEPPALPMDLPLKATFDQGLDNGHFLLFLAAMILMAISFIFKGLVKRDKKAE